MKMCRKKKATALPLLYRPPLKSRLHRALRRLHFNQPALPVISVFVVSVPGKLTEYSRIFVKLHSSIGFKSEIAAVCSLNKFRVIHDRIIHGIGHVEKLTGLKPAADR